MALGVGAFFGVRALVGLVGDLIAGEGAPVEEQPSPTGAGATPTAPEPTEVTTEQLANPVACEPDVVALSVGLPADGMRAGSEAGVPVTVTNTGRVPCLVDVGTGALTLDLESGDDLVWSSAHCGDPEGSRRLLLDLGGEASATVSWPGTRSAEGCPADPSGAEPGTYRMTATLDVGTAVTDEESFTLR